jgi:4-hydroxybenzoate polyprenyltransferase
MPLLRTFLHLSRVYYLPTVWSNCLAGMWLSGVGDWAPIPFVLLAVTFLFLSGSFLKDACSAVFDAQHRRWRPIASGQITGRNVLLGALYWFVMGVGLLFWVKPLTGVTGIAFGLVAFGYAASHRAFVLSPWLLGLCRLALYLIGASLAGAGINGWALWGGVAVAVYTAGTKYLSPRAPGTVPGRWPVLLLMAPVLLGLGMNDGEFREAALLLSVVLALWVLRCIRHSWWSQPADHSAAASGLVAGTVLVDWLAVADAPKQLSVVFILLFVAAVGLQRVRPVVAKSPA